MRIRIGLLITSIALLGAITVDASAQQATFIQDGKLVIFKSETGVGTVSSGKTREGLASGNFSAYWGSLADGRLVLTSNLEEGAKENHDDPDHHCLVASEGKAANLVKNDGTVDMQIYPDVLRAYPSPAGELIALISPARNLLIWQKDKVTTISAPGKVSNVGWSPDGRRFVASIYPPDWSEGAVSTANTTADFLRLQNADIYLYDVATGQFVSQLSSDPGTEYGAFFSPDGSTLYYTWLHLMEDAGGLMELSLDGGNGTTSSQPARQLTHAGNDPGEIPLGRVTTYQWLNRGSELAFESGLPDGSGEIWTMRADGTAPMRHSDGRKPQRISEDSVAFIKGDGSIQVYRSEVKP